MHTVVCSNSNPEQLGWESEATCSQHRSESSGAGHWQWGVHQCSHPRAGHWCLSVTGVCQWSHTSVRTCPAGLFCSGAEAQQPPHSPSVLGCWVSPGVLGECSSPAEPESPRKTSLLPVLHPSNLLQDIKVCCTGLMPASNVASDMFKQIIDILFTKVFTMPYPSPIFFPILFPPTQSRAWAMCRFAWSLYQVRASWYLHLSAFKLV